MKKKNKKIFVGLSIIFVTIVLLSFLQLSQSLVYFYTPDEVLKDPTAFKDKTIRVGGMVLPQSVKFESLILDFIVSDLKGSDIEVSYKGTPPDLFKEGQGVVVEGSMDPSSKTIKATKLMVKHSEEYQKPDAEHSYDKELLKESLFKD